MENKIFVSGLISKEVPATAPDFVLGKLALNVKSFQEWLTNNAQLQDEGGWINLTVLKSKSTSKRYIEVDTWKPKQELPEVKVELGEANPEDVPF